MEDTLCDSPLDFLFGLSFMCLSTGIRFVVWVHFFFLCSFSSFTSLIQTHKILLMLLIFMNLLIIFTINQLRL